MLFKTKLPLTTNDNANSNDPINGQLAPSMTGSSHTLQATYSFTALNVHVKWIFFVSLCQNATLEAKCVTLIAWCKLSWGRALHRSPLKFLSICWLHELVRREILSQNFDQFPNCTTLATYRRFRCHILLPVVIRVYSRMQLHISCRKERNSMTACF